jgi:class 3 adenylate cyclase/tetratricopeptide (TPR) repeat protein
VICAACGTHNEPGTRFCDECGAALAAACPNCGSSNRPNAKFCATCGTALNAQPAPAAQRAESPIAERRLVSVLFVDLVGFTPFAEEKDPEQVRDTLDRYFAIARLAIERHGGTIEKFIGDAVMAVWGTPTAHEDDAERAVRAALELVDAVHELGPDIDARAGIMTGEAAVNLGAEGQGMVAGDLVNTASRVQSVAPAGAVLVGEATMRAARAAVTFEPVGAQDLKGKAAPVQAYRATRVVANRGGQSRSELLEAPFVGREEELRQLKELLHTQSRDPRVRLVSIVGPAGIGKSRLTWEFEKYVDGLVETIFWHRGRSPAYGEGVTFWALGEMVRRRAELSETDDEQTTRARIAASVEQFVEDPDERAWIEVSLLALLGVEPAPAGGRERMFSAWRIYLERIATQGTTALVFEDLQWADDGLLDFIEHVLEWSKNLPLLLITLSRPEIFDRRPGWASNQRFMTALTLEPLSDDNMRELLAGLAPGLPERTVAAVLSRADGIPLYAVEIVRMLVADGKLELIDGAYRAKGDMGELAVPETLRSLIASRLDALDPADRGLLQDGAVLGQRFTLAAMSSVTGSSDDELQARLRNLARREFLDLEADPRSPVRGQYGFVQSLIREVAYGTLSKRDRRARHLAAARFYEAIGDEELAGALATHYLAAFEASADGPERDAVGAQARLALRAAGERAAALGAHGQAVTFLRQALQVTTEQADRAAVLALLADSANPSGQHDLAESSARESIDLYRAMGNDGEALTGAALLGRILVDIGKLHAAGPALEEALERRSVAVDDVPSASVLAVLARIYMRLNEPELSVAAADRALKVAEHERADAILAEALLNKGTSYGQLGRRHEGRVLLAAAVELAGQLGLYEVQLRGMNNLAATWADDELRRSLSIIRESIALARQMGQAGLMNWQIGTASMFSMSIGDDWDAPIHELQEVLDHEQTAHDRGRTLAVLALFRVARGSDGDAALERARLASAEVDENQAQSTIAWGAAMSAYFNGNHAQAIEFGDRAVELWNNYDIVVLPISARAAAMAGRRSDFDRIRAAIDSMPARGRMHRATAMWAAAMAGALDGDSGEASRLFAETANQLKTIGYGLEHAWVLLDAALMLPEDPMAREWASRAREVFERVEARPFLDLLDAAQAKIGQSDATPGKSAQVSAAASESAAPPR